MMYRCSLVLTTCSAILGLWIAAGTVAAQSSISSTPMPRAVTPSSVSSPFSAVTPQDAFSQWRSSLGITSNEDPRLAILQQMDGLLAALKEAESAEQKTAAQADVERALAEYFDLDVAHRRSELEALRTRTVDMEAHLARRAAAKAEIVGLQLQAFRFEAQGLGLGLFENGGVADKQSQFVTQVGRVTVLKDGKLVRMPVSRNVEVASGDFAMVRGASVAPDYAEKTMVMMRGGSAASRNPRADARKRIESLRQSLRTSAPTAGEVEIPAELEQALSDYFDLDMEARRAELDEVKQELRTLEAQLERRASSKQAILDLQVRMLVNQAVGLGFFSE